MIIVRAPAEYPESLLDPVVEFGKDNVVLLYVVKDITVLILPGISDAFMKYFHKYFRTADNIL